jgi:hypothetical protein
MERAHRTVQPRPRAEGVDLVRQRLGEAELALVEVRRILLLHAAAFDCGSGGACAGAAEAR